MTNLQTWAEWVAQIGDLTGGGKVEMLSDPYAGMITIAVCWEQDMKRMRYSYALSMREILEMNEAVQRCVLERITYVVRKMTLNVPVESDNAQKQEPSANRLPQSWPTTQASCVRHEDKASEPPLT